LAHFGWIEPFEEQGDVGGMALADEAQDAIRGRGTQHFAHGIVIEGRGFHGCFRR